MAKTQDELYETVCKPEFKEIKESLKKISAALYIDSNGASIQSKVNANTNNIKRILAIGTAVWGAALAGIVWIVQHLHNGL